MRKITFIAIASILFFIGNNNGIAQLKFELPTLPYAYNALEPYIDEQTMQIHHSKHHQAYINNLNKAVLGIDSSYKTMDDLLKNCSKLSTTIRNNAGGHYNHSLFWTILTPEKNTKPSHALHKAIIKQFTSMDSLKTLLNAAALKQFGSGWAWLCVDDKNELFISSTPNQDNPLMDVVDKKGKPILGIDVWEHAYYLKYQNKRGDYLDAIWNVLNWNEISRLYGESIK
jgi:Fe-Mn family superoxide dismutase